MALCPLWHRVDDREWKRCVATLDDLEQSLILSLGGTENKVILIAGLHEAVIEVEENGFEGHQDAVKITFRSNSKNINHENESEGHNEQSDNDSTDGKVEEEEDEEDEEEGDDEVEGSENRKGKKTRKGERVLRLGFDQPMQVIQWAAGLKRASFPAAPLWNTREQDLSKYAISRVSCEKIGTVWRSEGAQVPILIDSLRLCSINSLLDEDTEHSESIHLLLRLKVFGCTLSMDRVRICCEPDVVEEVEELKSSALRDLIEFVSQCISNGEKIDEVAFLDLMEMVSLNIMRPLNVFSDGEEMVQGKSLGGGRNPKNTCQYEHGSNWEHLSLLYDLFLKLIGSNVCELDIKKRCIREDFCRRFLQLFRSNDPREREYVKSITHCLYSRLVCHRAAMRQSMSHCFLEYVFACNHRRGVAEMLEVFGSIASGFATPIKEEHKHMLIKCLLPLHSAKGSEFYQEQLSFVLMQFATKDNDLVVPIVNALLKYWPKRSAPKQILFLGEIGEYMGLMEPHHFSAVQSRLVRQLCECISGRHFQVAEYAMGLLNNNYLYSMLFDNHNARRLVMPKVLSALRTATSSWNSSVKQIGLDIMDFFRNMDAALFHESERILLERQRARESVEQLYLQLHNHTQDSKHAADLQVNQQAAVLEMNEQADKEEEEEGEQQQPEQDTTEDALQSEEPTPEQEESSENNMMESNMESEQQPEQDSQDEDVRDADVDERHAVENAAPEQDAPQFHKSPRAMASTSKPFSVRRSSPIDHQENAKKPSKQQQQQDHEEENKSSEECNQVTDIEFPAPEPA